MVASASTVLLWRAVGREAKVTDNSQVSGLAKGSFPRGRPRKRARGFVKDTAPSPCTMGQVQWQQSW